MQMNTMYLSPLPIWCPELSIGIPPAFRAVGRGDEGAQGPGQAVLMCSSAGPTRPSAGTSRHSHLRSHRLLPAFLPRLSRSFLPALGSTGLFCKYLQDRMHFNSFSFFPFLTILCSHCDTVHLSHVKKKTKRPAPKMIMLFFTRNIPRILANPHNAERQQKQDR